MSTLLAAEAAVPPIPGTMTGILHPKVSNRFRVLFTVTALVDEDHEQIAQAMTFLTMQTIAVGIPEELHQGQISATGPARKHLQSISTKGDLTLILEDDVSHAAVRALEYLKNRTDTTIEIQKLDGNEGVVEVYLFGRCRLLSQQHSPLDYSQSTTCRRTLTIGVGYAQHGVLTPAQSQEF